MLFRSVDENSMREDVEAHHPRSPKSEHSLGILQLATCTKGQDTKEDSKDVQVKREKISK